MTIKVKLPYLIVAGIIIVASIVVDCNIFLTISLLLLISTIGILSSDFSKHIFLILFLTAFYVFLIGGLVTESFFSLDNDYVFSSKDYNHITLSLLLSLICILTGYYCGSKINTYAKIKSLDIFNYFSRGEETIRSVSKILFYVLCIPWYVVLAEQVIVVQANGYLEYYSYDSRLPGIVTNLAFICIFSFCLYLSTYPEKKDAKIPIALVLVYAGISLLVGRRIYFVIYVLLCLGYILCSNYDSNNEEEWISKKAIIFIIALTPVMVVLLYSLKYLRYDRSVEANSFLEAFLGFFKQQGFSAYLIGYGKVYESGLSKDLYSFYDTIRYLRKTPVAQLFGIDYDKYYTGTREYLAFNSGSYARIISYLSMKNAYLYGYGTGSCYIAELYHDFGYIGVVLGNLIYGLIISRFMVLKKGKTVRNCLGLILFYRMLMAPRYNFDYAFSFLYSIGFWVFVFIIIITLLFFNRKVKRKLPNHL